MNLLEVKGVSKYFGGVAAVRKADLTLQGGEIFGLIGPNGAGKTTLFNCIAGYYPTSEGSIIFGGREITSKPAHAICRMGISRTFQLVKIFSDMTALENVTVAALSRTNNVKRARKEALEVLDFVGRYGFERYAGLQPDPDQQEICGSGLGPGLQAFAAHAG